MRQIVWFLRLVFRPHPWAHPGMSRRDAWVKAILFPREAWRIAGIFASVR